MDDAARLLSFPVAIAVGMLLSRRWPGALRRVARSFAAVTAGGPGAVLGGRVAERREAPGWAGLPPCSARTDTSRGRAGASPAITGRRPTVFIDPSPPNRPTPGQEA